MTARGTAAAAILLVGAAWIGRGFGILKGEIPGLLGSLWPVGPELFRNLGWSLSCVLFAVFTMAVCDSSGSVVIRWIRRRGIAGAVRFSAPFAGYAVLSSLALATAAAGLWFKPVLGGLVLLQAAAAPRELERTLREWAVWGRDALRDASPPLRAALALLACWWALFLATPEVMLDSMEYHFAYPQQMLVTHRLIGRHLYVAAPLPLAADLPNGIRIAFGLGSTVQMTRVAFTLCGVIALLRTLRLGLSPAWELVVAAAAMTVPAARMYLFSAKSAGVMTGVLLTMFAIVLEGGFLRKGSQSYSTTFLLGLLGGFAVAIKLTILPFLAVLGLAMLYYVSSAGRIGWTAVVLAGGLLPLLPWMGRSWVFFADPFYPVGSVFLPRIFGEPAYNPATSYAWHLYSAEARTRPLFVLETVQLALRNAFPLLAGFLLLPGKGPLPLPLAWVVSAAGLAAMVAGNRSAIEFVERFTMPVFVMWNAAGFGALAALMASARGIGRILAVTGFTAVLAAANLALLADSYRAYPGLHPTLFLAGHDTKREFRYRGIYAHGDALPYIVAECGKEGNRGTMAMCGSRISWNIPVRVLGEGFETPFIWGAVYSSADVGRLRIKFRQAGVRWVLFNGSLAAWNKCIYLPWEWNPRMLRLYVDFALRYIELRVAPERIYPFFGDNWLFRVRNRPAPAARRILFLPGATSAFAFANLAFLSGHPEVARERFMVLRRMLPEVVWLDSMYAEVMLATGRWGEARALARKTAEEGLLDRVNVLVWGEAAARLGRTGEAERAFEIAERVYPMSHDEIAKVRQRAGMPGQRVQ